MKVGSNGKGGWRKILKSWGGYIGLLHNIGAARNPPPTMTQKELLWKKDALVVSEKSFKRLAKEFIFSKVSG